MKLIIDIPEEEYMYITKYQNVSGCGNMLTNSIINATPLDDVKVKIKETSIKYGGQTYDGLCIALKILDNIR